MRHSLGRRLAGCVAVLAAATTLVTPASASARQLRTYRLEHALARYVAHRSGTVTVGVYDLNAGQRVLYRPRHQERTASIVKVEILLALLARHHAPLRAQRKAEVRRMIENSSNTDANALWSAIGDARGAARFGRRVGLQSTTPAGGTGPGYVWGMTLTTPADQLRLLDLIARPNTVLTNRDRNYVRQLMGHVESDQRWGVSAGPSGAASVDLKNGWLELRTADWQINSIGYVRAPHHEYLIAVMTTGDPTMGYGVATVQHISRIVWRNTGWPPVS